MFISPDHVRQNDGGVLPDSIFIWVFAALLIVGWILNSPWLKGAFGEIRVSRSLGSLLAGAEYQLFNDLTLPARDGTTQIDHVILSRFGIFVIETKNMKGWIFGNADHASWTQVIYRRKSQFQNPIRQNYKHIKAVQELLGIDACKLHGVVAFVGSAVPKSAMPPGVVWGVKSLVEHVRSKRVAVINEDELRVFAASLSSENLKSSIRTRHAHIKQIKAQAADRLRNPEKCPRCGAGLVERTNRQSGVNFLACSRFPDCKGTRKLS